MRLRWDGTSRRGPAIDARRLDVAPRQLLEAVRDPGDDRLTCSSPRFVHRHVGLLTPTASLRRRAALAAVARSRGASTEYDPAIRDLQRELAAVEVPDTDVPAAVQRVADADEAVDALRDRVARLGGVVAARDDPDAVAAAQADLRTAAAELAEAETTRQAARQELARERDRQRTANDARERRLRLRDRLENRRRDARGALADRVASQLARARDAIPAWDDADADAEFALAVARVAAVRAPVIVVDGPFRTAVQARACLDGPVVLASAVGV